MGNVEEESAATQLVVKYKVGSQRHFRTPAQPRCAWPPIVPGCCSAKSIVSYAPDPPTPLHMHYGHRMSAMSLVAVMSQLHFAYLMVEGLNIGYFLHSQGAAQ